MYKISKMPNKRKSIKKDRKGKYFNNNEFKLMQYNKYQCFWQSKKLYFIVVADELTTAIHLILLNYFCNSYDIFF